MGRSRTSEAFEDGIIKRLVALSELVGELDNENAVFGRQAHQHDQADLAV
jgi:hypothetical protein